MPTQGVGHTGVPYENKPIYGFPWVAALQWRISANHSRMASQTILDLYGPRLWSPVWQRPRSSALDSYSCNISRPNVFSSSLLCFCFVVDLSGKWKNSSPHSQLQIEESVKTTCRTHWLLNLANGVLLHVKLCQIETWQVSGTTDYSYFYTHRLYN